MIPSVPTPNTPPVENAKKTRSGVQKVMILGTAMLSFIPFWKAAAVALCDFGSSAFYAGGIAMKAFGPAFPWYILAIMLISGILLMVSIEGSGMFVRGGVYPIVKEGLGPKTAKVAVSAIMFDFLLTGPISSVSAGHYLVGLLNSILEYLSVPLVLQPDVFAVIMAVLVTCYFWRQNIKGIGDSSDKSFKIILTSTVVCVILIVWSVITIIQRGPALPPVEPVLTPQSLGWAANIDWFKTIGFVGVLMALGHSVLALSGLETLSQLYREIEYPKIQNLKKAALLVFGFALVFTGGLTFLSGMIIPADLIATEYYDNLLAGLAMELNGPVILKIILQAGVVLVGVAMLSGAVNTSLIGSNAVLNRVAEDGILTDWFRKIHKKYGTTYHMIHIVALSQIAIILLSRGKVYLLGEAYAFGVLWSLVLETASILVMRFTKDDCKRPFTVPFNIRIKGVQIPVGLSMIFLFLFSLASINLITKKTATISGLTFTAFLYMVFYISERRNAARANEMFEEGHREQINTTSLLQVDDILKKLKRKHRVLVGVKNPDNLYHLDVYLEGLGYRVKDVIVLYARPKRNMRFGRVAVKPPIDENELFSNIIQVAEKYGKSVIPLVVESNDYFYALAQMARTLDVSEIIMGVSGTHGANEQMERLVMAWGAVKEGVLRHGVRVHIIWEGREVTYKFNN